MMRKKGIIILVVIIVIFAVIAFFARDRYLERAIESVGQSIAGAKVEIDNFHFSLFKLTCSWDRIQVADKNDTWRNILETGKASFVLETRPLFWKRVIIKEMALENVRSGTKRTTDGKIPKKPVQPSDDKPGMADKAKTALAKQMKELPVFDLSGLGKELKIDSLVNVNNLETVQGYIKLKSYSDSTFKYWEKQADTQPYVTRLAKLETNIKSLNIDNIKDIAALTDALKKLKDIQKEVKSLKSEVGGKYKSLTQTFDDVQTKLNDAKSRLQDDIKKAQQLARLKDLDVKDVSLLLFGDPVVQKAEKILDYVALGRKYLPKAKKAVHSDKKKSPPRFKGQNIRFPFHYRYPKFLLRKANFSAASAAGDTSRAYFLEGNLTGLTNDPGVYARPTRFKLNLKKLSGNAYDISGSMDHTTDVMHDSLWITAANFGLGEVKLKKSKYFPRALNAKKGDITLAGFFAGDAINIKLNMDAKPVTFLYETDAKDRISRIVREVLAGLNQVTLTAQMKGDTSDYKLRMNSNVDQILAKEVRKTLEKNLRQAQQQVEDYVRAEAGKRRKEVEDLIEKNRKKIYAELEKVNQQVQARVDEIEKRKKEVEQRIEEEKKKLEEKAKDKLKDLFKKPG